MIKLTRSKADHKSWHILYSLCWLMGGGPTSRATRSVEVVLRDGGL